eukprot:c33545_g1_i1 orf=457-1977(+)
MLRHGRKRDRSVLADATINQNNDVHKEALHGGVPVKTAEVKGNPEEKKDGVQGFPDVIIIEDDNGSSEVDNYDSEDLTRRSQSHYHSSSSDESSFHTSELSDSSDEEDCVVIEPHATVPPRRFLHSRKRPRPATDIPIDSNKRRSNPSDLSDCEIIVDSDGKVRQDWEEAALRRREGKARYRADSEESTSVSNHANNDPLRSPRGKKQIGNVRSHVRSSWEHATDQQPGHGFPTSRGGSSAYVKEKREGEPFDQQDSNLEVSAVGSDDSHEEASSAGHGAGDNLKPVQPGSGGDKLFSSLSGFDNVASGRLSDTHVNTCLGPNQDVTRASEDNIVTDREMLKRTKEFRHADEEEWARRHLELQKQAEEVQRERKRRKLEAERRIEMEARQKRRLEEIRQSQLKEEQTSGFKEQVRDRIQSDLERVAATCKDMATLLRRLGVPVDGGPFATNQQVSAAYKRALLRFHPDRAAALAKSDPTHQVEAEEKFKLVSRMKGVLPLVTSSFR